MSLVRLVYVSRPTQELGDQLESIVGESVIKNAERGITGLLISDPVFFLQWIEGPRKSVNVLYGELVQDNRHNNLELLDYRVINSRQFPTWDMACVGTDEINKSILLKYMYKEGFDPYLIREEGAVEFLKEVGSIIQN